MRNTDHGFKFIEPHKNFNEAIDEKKNEEFMGGIYDDELMNLNKSKAERLGISNNAYNRMTTRNNQKPFIIYPENKQKGIWDLFMTLVLIITCIMTPLNIAFNEDNIDETSKVLDNIIDLLFCMDIIVIFNSAFYNEDSEIIDDRKEIAKWYLTGWFTIDLLAVIPFDSIINASGYNQLARVTRVGRLYKLVKLTRLFRMLKVVK